MPRTAVSHRLCHALLPTCNCSLVNEMESNYLVASSCSGGEHPVQKLRTRWRMQPHSHYKLLLRLHHALLSLWTPYPRLASQRRYHANSESPNSSTQIQMHTSCTVHELSRNRNPRMNHHACSRNLRANRISQCQSTNSPEQHNSRNEIFTCSHHKNNNVCSISLSTWGTHWSCTHCNNGITENSLTTLQWSPWPNFFPRMQVHHQSVSICELYTHTLFLSLSLLSVSIHHYNPRHRKLQKEMLIILLSTRLIGFSLITLLL